MHGEEHWWSHNGNEWRGRGKRKKYGWRKKKKLLQGEEYWQTPLKSAPKSPHALTGKADLEEVERVEDEGWGDSPRYARHQVLVADAGERAHPLAGHGGVDGVDGSIFRRARSSLEEHGEEQEGGVTLMDLSLWLASEHWGAAVMVAEGMAFSYDAIHVEPKEGDFTL